MPIKFRCEHCRQLLGISTSKAGQIVDCPTCGRSVSVPDLDGKSAPVPPPQLDLGDPSLQSALDALARIGSLGDETLAESAASQPPEDEFPTVNTPESPPKRGSGAAIVLPPAPRPEPIALPALHQPIALVESSPLPAPLPIDAAGNSSPEAALEQLAAWSSATNVRRPESAQPLPTGRSTSSGWGMALVAFLAFATGFLVHAQFFSSPQNSPAPQAAANAQDPQPERQPDKPLPSPAAEHSTAVKGRITFRTVDGTSQPDAGACVILLPESRTGSAKLSITGFRPADLDADRELARASIRALGGDLALVDESGNFNASLAQSGRYHVLVISHFQPRLAGEASLSPAERTVLAGYFDRPDQLAGKLRYEMAQIVYRGEGSETWDYSFERI